VSPFSLRHLMMVLRWMSSVVDRLSTQPLHIFQLSKGPHFAAMLIQGRGFHIYAATAAASRWDAWALTWMLSVLQDL
jgi:hypothetical protein